MEIEHDTRRKYGKADDGQISEEPFEQVEWALNKLPVKSNQTSKRSTLHLTLRLLSPLPHHEVAFLGE